MPKLSLLDLWTIPLYQLFQYQFSIFSILVTPNSKRCICICMISIKYKISSIMIKKGATTYFKFGAFILVLGTKTHVANGTVSSYFFHFFLHNHHSFKLNFFCAVPVVYMTVSNSVANCVLYLINPFFFNYTGNAYNLSNVQVSLLTDYFVIFQIQYCQGETSA